MSTYNAKKDEVARNWYVIDLKGKPLGRAATKIADVLRGKNKPQYTPNVDTGDFVVAINAAQVKLTGRKNEDKMYYHHTGYMGGIKSYSADDLRQTNPAEIIKRAVKGMLPKNILSRAQFKKLKIYATEEHPHAAQKPQEISL